MKELNNGTFLRGEYDYRIEKCLGCGGFGITYLASSTLQVGNIKQKMPFTIKEFFMQQLCQRQPNGDMTVVQGMKDTVSEHQKEFLCEAERLNKLKSHPGIVGVNEIFHQNNTVYYVMEYLGSVNLETYVKQHGGKLAEADALPIFRRLAEALLFLHEQKITHLDVKPANIMMHTRVESEGPVPVLIDFGLAIHYGKKDAPTHENNLICCSDGYSPMEQYLGISTFSPETDIYALGATLLYMLTGEKPPVASAMNREFIDGRLKGIVSDSTLAILQRSMERLADARYHSLAEVLRDLGSDTDAPAPDTQEEEDSDETRVVGRKTISMPKAKKRIATPKKPKTVDKPKANIDKTLLRKIGMAVAALVLVGIIVVGAMNSGSLIESCSNEEGEEVDTPKVDVRLVNPEEKADIEENENQENQESQETENKKEPSAENEDKAPVQPAEKKAEEKKTEVQEQKSEEEAVEKIIVSNSIDLGYGIYTGEIVNGKPNGAGTIVYSESHRVEERDKDANMAEPGESVTGKFENGHIVNGKLKKNDGSTKIIIGGSMK